MTPTIDTSYNFMVYSELSRTREKLLTEEDEHMRDILNAHFKNISGLVDEIEEEAKSENN